MSIVRISLQKGKPRSYMKVLLDGGRHGIVEGIDVPPDERFPIIYQHKPAKLMFDRSNMGGSRTDGYVLINMPAFEGWSFSSGVAALFPLQEVPQ